MERAAPGDRAAASSPTPEPIIDASPRENNHEDGNPSPAQPAMPGDRAQARTARATRTPASWARPR